MAVLESLTATPVHSQLLRQNMRVCCNSNDRNNKQLLTTPCHGSEFVIFVGKNKGWTELAKEAPGFHSFLAPTPATLSNFTIIRYCTLYTQSGLRALECLTFPTGYHSQSCDVD